MKNDPVGKFGEILMSDSIKFFPNELEDNGIGFWRIVPYGAICYDLEDSKLVNFVRKVILEVIAKGGHPVVASKTQPVWKETFQYGTKPDEIADNVIAEWLSEGGSTEVEWGRWWFAYPNSHR